MAFPEMRAPGLVFETWVARASLVGWRKLRSFDFAQDDTPVGGLENAGPSTALRFGRDDKGMGHDDNCLCTIHPFDGRFRTLRTVGCEHAHPD